MIQDIYPKTFHCEYKEKTPGKNSRIFFFSQDRILAAFAENEVYIPTYQEISEYISAEWSFRYLFAIDDTDYFLCSVPQGFEMKPYRYEKIGDFRYFLPKDVSFAALTAYQLYIWYRDNRYCGRCGALVNHDHKERMLYCSKCHNAIYPKIAPAVIVSVISGDRILLAKSAVSTYKKYGLIAGFTEIGETAEDTVRREVMEETGLKVKNITYYKSQPWAFGGNLLLGYYAELDGTDEITLDRTELEKACWFNRNEISEEDDGISMTREMIIKFKNGYSIKKDTEDECSKE